MLRPSFRAEAPVVSGGSVTIVGLSKEHASSFRGGASINGMTLGAYLVALLRLHEPCSRRAE